MSPGALVLVATPIGNLDDVSPRVTAALAGADAIGCEDTRRTGRLLSHLGVAAPRLIVVNEHTERDTVPGILDRLARGERVALVSDAGLPGISDPGEVLVRAAVEAGFAVEVIPGPSAAAAALVVSGLPTARFVFEGFLPRKGSARARRLAAVAGEERTVVLYEAPHRLARTVADLAGACGADRRVVFARELTKLHEEVWRGTLGEALERVAAVEPARRARAGARRCPRARRAHRRRAGHRRGGRPGHRQLHPRRRRRRGRALRRGPQARLRPRARRPRTALLTPKARNGRARWV